MRSEIGSEFWDIPLAPDENNFFPPHTTWHLSGRAALASVLKDICAKCTAHTAALPSWCCESMIQPFLDAGFEVFFYPVHMIGGVLYQEQGNCPPCDVTLVMDYFGYRQAGFAPKGGTVIYDATHSLLSGRPREADYVFGSLRKWAGFYSGGFAYAAAGIAIPTQDENDRAARYIALRRRAMGEKYAYLTGKTEEKVHLKTFAAAEELLDAGLAGSPDTEDITSARHLDTELLRGRRRENAAILLEYVKEWAVFRELQENDCPLFVPIIVPAERRDALRRHLVNENIFCPIHWPVSPLHRLDEQTREIYQTELSLVCDQRYGADDMRRVGQAVQSFLKGTDTI